MKLANLMIQLQFFNNWTISRQIISDNGSNPMLLLEIKQPVLQGRRILFINLSH